MIEMNTVEEARLYFAERIHKQGGIESASLIRESGHATELVFHYDRHDTRAKRID